MCSRVVCFKAGLPALQARRMDVIICPHGEWSFALVRRTFCLHGMAACALCLAALDTRH